MESYYKPEDLPKFAEIREGSPELAEKFFDYYAAVFTEGALTQREKSLIALAVATAAAIDDRPSAFAPDLDFNLIAIHQIAVQQGQSNSAPAVGFTLPRGQPDPFALPVRNHGPAGHIPHMLIAAKHIGFSPRNSLIDQRNGPYHAGQVGNQRIVSVDDAFEGFVLSGQRRTADERPF